MSSDNKDALLNEARAWAADDSDPNTLEALRRAIAAEDLDSIREGFDSPLEFGTAGLRGLLGFGPGRMNLVTVGRATAGLAQQLIADVPDALDRGVVVGRDARRMSTEFAKTVAELLAGYGFQVFWNPEPVPTPVAAFAGRHLNAAATVVVTASHNPPEYNGYKVFSERGSQIVSPQDKKIHQGMLGLESLRDLPRVSFDEGLECGKILPLGSEMEEAYLKSLSAQCVGPTQPPAQVRCVTTALHGVGHYWIDKALRARGYEELYPVEAQAQPDGGFPTVRFPNPEEEGALDLALSEARAQNADLILANDPDTDRLCVAVRAPELDAGYHVLSGNDLGVLLADWLLRKKKEAGTLPDGALVVTTVVSTTMLASIAKVYGVESYEVLTGFKWIWDKALSKSEEGGVFIFGFEEALGYCVGPAVRDKDGIGAAQVLMELASDLKSKGLSLSDRLEELWRTHGLHATKQVATVLPGAEGKARIAEIMAALRKSPPKSIAGVPVLRYRDLIGAGADEEGLPRSNVLTWWLEGRERVVLRPSGTEPKLKVYLEACAPLEEGDSLDSARVSAGDRLDELAQWARDLVAA